LASKGLEVIVVTHCLLRCRRRMHTTAHR
jgi:hypothetical protein